MDVKKIREDFPILSTKMNEKPLIYFDNAATTQKPVQVLNSLKEYYENYNANIHRGIYYLSEKASTEYENAHKKVASLIGSDWHEVIFTKNASESLNILAYSLGLNFLKPGDEVLITKMEHHSNFVPWHYLAKKLGFNVKYANVTKQGELDLEHFDSLLSEKTKIVSVVHASNVLGTINPVREIIEKANDRGALTIIDGAQSAPHMEINVKKLGCDFFAFAAHKMLGPTGVGVLYGKTEQLEKMEPFLLGGDMISEVSVENISWNSLPWKFEAGTPNIGGGIAFGTAVDYLKKIGMRNVRTHEIELLEYAFERLNELGGVTIYGPPPEKRTGVISFNLQGVHPHDVATVLDSFGIAIRAGGHCAHPLLKELGVEGTARASFYIYNTKGEIDSFIDSLEETKKVFRV